MIKCKTKDCKLMAYRLSMQDEARTIGNGGVIDWDRTTKWKCPNGHLTKTKSVVTTEELTPAKTKEVDTSGKRFHRKGYKHRLADTKNPNSLRFVHPAPKYPPNLTNHQRVRMRAEELKDVQNQRRAVTEATLKEDF